MRRKQIPYAITASFLRKMGACERIAAAFGEKWPKGLPLSMESYQTVKNDPLFRCHTGWLLSALTNHVRASIYENGVYAELVRKYPAPCGCIDRDRILKEIVKVLDRREAARKRRLRG